MLYPPPLCFITLVHDPCEEQHARLFAQSLRAFGGALSQAPLWVFHPHEFQPLRMKDNLADIHIFPLDTPEDYPRYLFADKVCACAQAEAMTGRLVNTLVWVNPECLVTQPPLLFDLGQDLDAAFRPVHIRNIGSPIAEAPDGFWQAIYRAVGLKNAPYNVESFVDAQTLRPYFNNHCFSTCPASKLLREWQRAFKSLALDHDFQSTHCAGELRQVFLHQAILSALVAKRVSPARMRILPPEYSYPLHLHPRVPPERQPRSLNALTCPVYEDAFHFPASLNSLAVEEPLASWLFQRTQSQS